MNASSSCRIIYNVWVTTAMDCSKVGALVFFGLMIMTAGFVLTLAGWFAPAIKSSVVRVRTAGPSMLLLGLIMLICSCIICSVQQRRCSRCCYYGLLGKKHRHDFTDEEYEKEEPSENHVIRNQYTMTSPNSPLLLRELGEAAEYCQSNTGTPIQVRVVPLGRRVRYDTYTNHDRQEHSKNPDTYISPSSPDFQEDTLLESATSLHQAYSNITCTSPSWQRRAATRRESDVWHLDETRSPPQRRQSKHWPLFVDFDQEREVTTTVLESKPRTPPRVYFQVHQQGKRKQHSAAQSDSLTAAALVNEQEAGYSHTPKNRCQGADDSVIFVNRHYTSFEPHSVQIMNPDLPQSFKQKPSHDRSPNVLPDTQPSSQPHSTSFGMSQAKSGPTGHVIMFDAHQPNLTENSPFAHREALTTILRDIPLCVEYEQSPESPANKRPRTTDTNSTTRKMHKVKRHISAGEKQDSLRKIKEDFTLGKTSRNAVREDPVSLGYKPSDPISLGYKPSDIVNDSDKDSITVPHNSILEPNTPGSSGNTTSQAQLSPFLYRKQSHSSELKSSPSLLRKQQPIVLPRPGNYISYHQELDKMFPSNAASSQQKPEVSNVSLKMATLKSTLKTSEV